MQSPLKVLRFFLCAFLCQYGVGIAYGLEGNGYQGIPWDSPFPVIERHFPGTAFVSEDPYHVTLFRLPNPEEHVTRIEFKLFENKLVSVLRYYDGNIDHLINEQYISALVGGLGTMKDRRTTTAPSLAGTATVDFLEYEQVMVLFRHYPPGQEEGLVAKENSIVIIYRPTFENMVHHRKYGQAETEGVQDYDYIDF